MKKITIYISIVLLLQSCALIFSGTKDKIHISNGSPHEAKVFYNGSYIGTAPTSVKISKNGLKRDNTTIRVESDGYEPEEIRFVRKIKIGAFVGDCLTGFIWLIPDFLTGAIYKASPASVSYNLSIANKSPVVNNYEIGDNVIFSNDDFKNKDGVVKIVYPNRLVITTIKVNKLTKKESEVEVEVPLVNVSKK